MKVRDMIQALCKLDGDLELYKIEWSEWDLDFIYFKIPDKKIPVTLKTKKHLKQLNEIPKGKYFVCI